MNSVIQRYMVIHDNMPAREICMESDDFRYLSDYVMHCRYIACQDEPNVPVPTLHLFEAAKTIVYAFEILSKIKDIAFYDINLLIDHDNKFAKVSAGIRYTDNWHTILDDCRFVIWFFMDNEFIGYQVEFIREGEILEQIRYPLYYEFVTNREEKEEPFKIYIFGYDMNFPLPTEFRRIIKMTYNELTFARRKKEHELQIEYDEYTTL